MNTPKLWMLGTAGAALFALSFGGIALLSGWTLGDVSSVFSWASRPAPISPPDGVVREFSADDSARRREPRHEVDVKPTMSEASLISAFVLPSPFSADELARLQAELQARVSDARERLSRIQRREAELDERERAVESRIAELLDLRASIERNGRTATDDLAINEKSAQGWKDLSRFFVEGDVKSLAKKLCAFAPAEAAFILRELDDERAIEIVNALPPADYKSILDAYRRLPR